MSKRSGRLRASGRPALSIVIPTLDEGAALPLLLADLARQTLRAEILVVDGGSTDGTPTLAHRAGVRCLRSEVRGRGAQMNRGAEAALSERLLFLHADTRIGRDDLLQRAMDHYEAEVAVHPQAVAGHFPLRFAAGDAEHARLRRFMEAKTRSNRRWTINGDQGLWIGRSFFERIGGFDARLPFFEDQRIAARIEAADGRWILLPGELETSFRRFEREGALRRYALMALMMGMHAADLDGFLEHAPGIYTEQGRSRGLELRPFVRLARRMLVEQGRRAPRHLLQAGRFVRENTWQLALLAELSGVSSALSLFDHRIAPRLDHPWVDAAFATLVAAGLFIAGPSTLLDGLQRLRQRS